MKKFNSIAKAVAYAISRGNGDRWFYYWNHINNLGYNNVLREI